MNGPIHYLERAPWGPVYFKAGCPQELLEPGRLFTEQQMQEAIAAEREACWKAARAGLFKIPAEYEFSRDIVDHYVCGAIRARSK